MTLCRGISGRSPCDSKKAYVLAHVELNGSFLDMIFRIVSMKTF